MSELAFHCLLAASRSRLENLAREFRQGGKPDDYSDMWTGLVFVGSVGLALWLLSRFMDRRQKRSVNRPRVLFLGLCRVHRLKWSERWLLWRLAKFHRLRAPGRVFVEPERFDVARLPLSLRARESALLALRDRIFAGLADEDTQVSGDEATAVAAPAPLVAAALAPLSQGETPQLPAALPLPF